jgi:hypothetical protein
MPFAGLFSQQLELNTAEQISEVSVFLSVSCQSVELYPDLTL